MHGFRRWRPLNGRLGLHSLWLQAKVCDHRLGLQPRLFADSVCDDSAAVVAYAAIVALCK